MTADRLASAQRDYDHADRRREELRLHRNRLVREALADGWTHAQISEATGLSRGRISQIRNP